MWAITAQMVITRLVLQPQGDVVALAHGHGRRQDDLHLYDVSCAEMVRPHLPCKRQRVMAGSIALCVIISMASALSTVVTGISEAGFLR